VVLCRLLRLASATAAAALALVLAQEPQRPVFRVNVDMVMLTFTVTDSRGRYIEGLKPEDLRILEDGRPQKIATFAQGSKPAVQVLEDGSMRPIPTRGKASAMGPEQPAEALVGTNVFVLFDTSNYMYRGFAYASDAITDFIRGLDRSDSVAVYTCSRNLSRTVPLTADRDAAIQGLRKAVAGSDSALYNCMLLTLRDAAKAPGRKVLIVFSNGPDTASMIAPDDVRTVAEDEGIPIYVISTNEVNKDPVSSGVFPVIANRTGGTSYFASTWQKQIEAFESIREDLGNAYTVTYYPTPNLNQGFRRISVRIVSDVASRYRVRARPGYRPSPQF
jgi:Ca-activated chloride channel homolog